MLKEIESYTSYKNESHQKVQEHEINDNFKSWHLCGKLYIYIKEELIIKEFLTKNSHKYTFQHKKYHTFPNSITISINKYILGSKEAKDIKF